MKNETIPAPRTWDVFLNGEYVDSYSFLNKSALEVYAALISSGMSTEIMVYPTTGRVRCVYCGREVSEEWPSCCKEYGHVEPIPQNELEDYA